MENKLLRISRTHAARSAGHPSNTSESYDLEKSIELNNEPSPRKTCYATARRFNNLPQLNAGFEIMIEGG